MVQNCCNHLLLHQVIDTLVKIIVYLLIAVLSLLIISTVISNVDGLLSTSTGFSGPPFSLTVYVDWLKDTVMTK